MVESRKKEQTKDQALFVARPVSALARDTFQVLQTDCRKGQKGSHHLFMVYRPTTIFWPRLPTEWLQVSAQKNNVLLPSLCPHSKRPRCQDRQDPQLGQLCLAVTTDSYLAAVPGGGRAF